MFCSKCGMQNNNGERFCRNCGVLLENNQNQQQPNYMNDQNQQQPNYINDQNQQQPNYMNDQNQQRPNYMNGQNQQYINMSEELNHNYVNRAVNPNMKKWAILSIIVAVVAIVWYIFIGLSFYIAILIASFGFGFAQKGEMDNKKLAMIGKVANGILIGMAITMVILQLIGIFSK